MKATGGRKCTSRRRPRPPGWCACDTLDLRRFRRFAEQVDDLALDCVLEVKDKEQSVLRARRIQLGGDEAARPA